MGKIENLIKIYGCTQTSEDKKDKIIILLTKEIIEILNKRINEFSDDEVLKLFNYFFDKFDESLIYS